MIVCTCWNNACEVEVILQALVRRFWGNRDTRMLIVALLLGIVSAGFVMVFETVLEGVRSWFFSGTHAASPHPRILEPARFTDPLWYTLPLLAGLGAMTGSAIQKILSPGTRSSSTQEVVDAFHAGHQIPARLSILTMFSASLTIGTGGAAGKEGPAALIGAATSTQISRWLRIPEADRPIVMLMGLSATLAAAFGAPIGAAFFAIEFLYAGMAFETGALIYTLICALAGYVAAGMLHGFVPYMAVQNVPDILDGTTYGGVLAVGLLGGVLAAIIPTVFHSVRAMFHKMPGPALARPFVGGAIVGAIGMFVPAVLGEGSGWIHTFATTPIALQVLLALLCLKTIAFSFTVGSGGVGGVLAPNLFIGATLGAAIATWYPGFQAAFVVVGMSAVFASAARVPIATLLLVPEMTGNYALLPATALAVAASYFVQIMLTSHAKNPTLHEHQPAHYWESPTHHHEVVQTGLSLLQNGAFSLPEDMELPDLEALLKLGHPVPLGAGDMIVVQASVRSSRELEADQALAGSRLAEGRLGSGVWLLEIRRAEGTLVPRPDTVLHEADQLILLMSVRQVEELKERVQFSPVFLNWMKRHGAKLLQTNA